LKSRWQQCQRLFFCGARQERFDISHATGF
jgi:hypothetical protein